jgi:tetratricopeptide (TPR) repeat protein
MAGRRNAGALRKSAKYQSYIRHSRLSWDPAPDERVSQAFTQSYTQYHPSRRKQAIPWFRICHQPFSLLPSIVRMVYTVIQAQENYSTTMIPTDMSESSNVITEKATVHALASPSKALSPNTEPQESSNMMVSSFSNMANQAISRGQYRNALTYYQQALEDYSRESPTVVQLVNAAATCFNLGALSKKLQDYQSAAKYFRQAENIYRTCEEHVKRADFGNLEQSSSCNVCLIQLIVETLQARAHLHYKYQQLLDEAIECHEEVVEILEQHRIYGDDTNTIQFKIRFQPLLPEQRCELLVTSLQFLGKFYVEKGDLEDGLMAYQEVLKILKDLDSAEAQQKQEETIQIIKALEEIHSKRNENASDYSNAAEASEMQRLALLQEDIENWEKALNYWERVLYYQSKEFGEESFEVAIALCQVARVMVAQGNYEGALDLYQAASLKYQNTKTLLPNELVTNTVQVFQLLQQPLEAIAWLEELSLHSEVPEEKAWILYELGRLYLEQGQLRESSRALCRSAELGEGDEEHVFKLLQKVEFLQQRMEFSDTTATTLLALEAINEGEEEDASLLSSVLSRERIGAPITITSSMSSGLGYDDEEKKVDMDEMLKSSEARKKADFEAMRAAVNADALSIVTEEEKVDESHAEMHQPVHHIHFANSMYATESANSSFPDGSEILDESAVGIIHGDDDKSSRSLSPIRPRQGAPSDENLLTTPALEASPFEDEADEGNAAEDDEAVNRVLFSNAAVAQTTELDSKSKESIHQSVSYGLQAVEPIPSDEQFPSSPLSTNESSPEPTYPQTDDPIVLSRSFSPSGSSSPISESADALISNGHDAVGLGSTMFISASSSVPTSDVNDDDVKSEMIDIDADSTTEQPQATTATEEPRIGTTTIDKEPTSSVASQPPVSVDRNGQLSPANSETSRTGLLQSDEKATAGTKGLRMPSFTSPKNPSPPKSNPPRDFKNPILRIKRDYAEMPRASKTETSQNSKPATRKRFVNALASPFRRARSKRSTGLDALDEDKEVGTTLPFDDDVAHTDAPVSFIFDDDDQSQVSQITFRMEEYSSRKSSRDGQWWWGVSKEGLEGWFPSDYVHQAVQAAEGFLSAKSIHDRAKSRPLDFDSEDESDIEDEHVEEKNHKASEVKLSESPQAPENVPKPEALSSHARNISVETPGVRSKSSNGASKIERKEELLEVQTLENGPEHISVATTLFELAVLNSKNNNLSGALDFTQRALEIQKSTLNMSDACKSLHFMADLHTKQTQFSAALSCYHESQRLQEAVFGYFHEETANTLNRIGNVFATQGEFGLAMENYKEALRILKECCGEEVKNPLVSQTLIQIGAVYYRERNSLATIQSKVDGYSTFIEGGMLEVIGRAHEERGSYRMALAFFEEKLQFLNDNDKSSDLEQVAETLNSLGMLSCRAGLYLEAIDYYDRALGIQMKLGCNEVQLAMARVLAGSVQYSLGHFRKALKLFQDAIDTLRDHVGSEQETVAATLFHMGVVRMALCEYDDAMSDFRDALEVQKKLLGNEHPATLRTRREIGNLYAVYESELDSAFDEFNDILAAQKRIHGEKHPNVAETLQSIGCAQAKKGDHATALRTLEECYNMRLEYLGMDHPLQATTLHEIAKIQVKRGRLKKAIHICDAALNIRVESLSEQHIDVAMALTTKASCFVAQNSFAEANKFFSEALGISDAAVGPIHPCVATIHEQIGIMHLRQCHFEEASASIQKALEIYRQSNLDDDHPGIKEALKELEQVERAEMLCV